MLRHSLVPPFVWAAGLGLLLSGGACRSPESPSLAGLELGLSYDDTVAICGFHGDHLHDRGVRILTWAFPDGSSVESGIHDGRISGLNSDAAGLGGRSQAFRATQAGLHPDMTEWELREHFSPSATTTEDSSDRECRWAWSDGVLTATFMDGKLERATWLRTGTAEAEVLVEPEDRLELLFAALRSDEPSVRYRALLELRALEDWRIADEVLELLAVETERANRTQAALILADRRDERASDLLLPDLEENILPDDLLDAIGRIGNHRAAEALIDAERRVGSFHTRAAIRSARARILARLEP